MSSLMCNPFESRGLLDLIVLVSFTKVINYSWTNSCRQNKYHKLGISINRRVLFWINMKGQLTRENKMWTINLNTISLVDLPKWEAPQKTQARCPANNSWWHVQAFVSCIQTDTNNFLALLTALVLLGHAKINTGETAIAGFKPKVYTKLEAYYEKILAKSNLNQWTLIGNLF